MSCPLGFVNTCVCTLLFVGSGCRQRDVYCIYEDFKKTKPTCKISLLLFKKKQKKSSCLLECANLLSKCTLFLGGEAETTVALCCDGKKQNKNQQQTIMKHKVCLLVGGKGGGQDKPKPAEIVDSARMFPCFFCCSPPPTRVEERQTVKCDCKPSSSPLLSSSLLSSEGLFAAVVRYKFA